MENKFGRGYVGGTGCYNSEIMIIGQSVGRYELESGKPFSGPAGSLLDEVLETVKIDKSDCYLTNVLKYQPLKELKLEKWEDYDSVEKLWEEIGAINPKKILCLGSIPTYFITGKKGITDYRGSILRSQRFGKITVGTYNPAHLLYQTGGEISAYWQKGIIEFDIRRLIKIKDDWMAPYRNLLTCRSSVDLLNFLSRHDDLDLASCDIETFKGIPALIGFAFKKTEAISIPLFQELDGFKITTIPQMDLVYIWRLIDKILRTKKIVGQNFKFDQEKLEKILIFLVKNFHADTMLQAAVLNPELPKSIAFLASIHTEEPFWKDEGKEFNPRKDDIKQWHEYHGKDCCVTREVFEVQDQDLRDENLFQYYYEYYHKLHAAYYELENIGLIVDESRRDYLIDKYKKQLQLVNQKLEAALGWLPKSVAGNAKDLHIAVYDTLKMPRRESLDEDHLVAMMANNAKTLEQRVGLQSIIDRRRLEKLLGPDRIGFRVDWDKKAKTNYRVSGAETGRRSTSMLKPPLRIDKIGLSFHAMSKHGDIGSDFRSMFIPPKNWVFVNQDLSQAEPRCVAHLSNDEDTLEMFDSGIDIHKFTAAIYLELGITRKAKTARLAIEMKDEVIEALQIIKPDERFVAKFVRNGGNYKMKKNRLMVEVNTNAKKFHIPINISEYRAGKCLEAFHAFTPKVREVFHLEIEMALRETRTLYDAFGGKRYFFDRFGDDLWKEGCAHIPQNTVANQVGRAILKSKEEMPDLQIVVEAHDAITWQAPIDEWEQRAKIVKKYMEAPIDFSNCSLKRGILQLKCDCEVGENYAEFKKVKLAA